MYNFMGVKIDTSKMNLEELEETQAKVQDLLANLNHEIVLRKMSNYKDSMSIVGVENLKSFLPQLF